MSLCRSERAVQCATRCLLAIEERLDALVRWLDRIRIALEFR